jgi:hypothetical protein
MTTAKDELAALRREVEALKAAQPKPPPSAEERERETREWIDKMHQMREGRMAMATPPSVVRDFAVLDDATVRGIIRDNRNAPTGPIGAIPSSKQGTGGGPAPSRTPGWVDPAPLGPPPGIHWVDAQLIADDVKQRSKEPKP